MYALPSKRYFSMGARRVAHYKEGEGEPLLFIHGFPTSSFLFTPVIPALAHLGFTCAAPDLMGLGDTLVPNKQDMSLESQGAYLHQYQREIMGVQSSVLVGHELGAAVALTLALQKPGMVRALILISPVFGDMWPVGVMRPLKHAAKVGPLFRGMFRTGLAQRSMKRMLAEGFHKFPDSDAYVEDFVRPYTYSPSSHERLRTLLTHLNPKLTVTFSSHLYRVKIPTLIIHGEHDPFIESAKVHALAASLPGATMVTLRDCGHFAPIEQPEPTASLITQFCHSLPKS